MVPEDELRWGGTEVDHTGEVEGTAPIQVDVPVSQ